MKLKRILAIILSLALIITSIPFVASAAGETYVQTDNGVYKMAADTDTSNVLSETSALRFGASDGQANGRVWTDKSVVLSTDGYDVTLSALAQEYLSYSGATYTISQCVDTVLILDLTSSMNDSFDGKKKITCLCDAVNDAIQTIMDSNPQNRVLVVGYSLDGSKPKLDTVLPLGRYENPSWTKTDTFDYSSSTNYKNGTTTTFEGKYLTYYTYKEVQTSQSEPPTNYFVCTGNGVQQYNFTSEAYEAFTQRTVKMYGSTDLQDGIIYGCQELVAAINNTTYDYDRAPFVMFLTDGYPGSALASQCFSNTPLTSGAASHESTGTPEYAAYTVLTAAYQKNQIKTAYENYNKKHKGEKAFGVQWFNVGIKCSGKTNCELTLNPSYILNPNSSSFSYSAKTAKTAIDNASKNTEYYNNYIYCAEGDIGYAESASDVRSSIDNLATAVSEFSKERLVPITSVEGETATTEIVFKDVLGKSMKPVNFRLYNENYEYIAIPNSTNTEFTFEGFKTKVTLSTNAAGNTVVTWILPGDEVDMFTISNKEALEQDISLPFEYQTANPSRLKYNVKMTAETDVSHNSASSYNNGTSDSNVEFYVPYDNPYYFNYTIDTSSVPYKIVNPVFKSVSDLKARDNISKADSTITNTTSYVVDNTYSLSTYDDNGTQREICKVVASVGNNGVADSTGLRVTKTADRSKVYTDGTITYTITVENNGSNTLSSVALNDTIPSKTSFVAGSATKDNSVNSISVSAGSVAMNVASLPAGSSAVFTYTVKLSGAVVGDTITSEIPKFTSVSGTSIIDNGSDSKSGPSVDVLEKPAQFTVTYKSTTKDNDTVIIDADKNIKLVLNGGNIGGNAGPITQKISEDTTVQNPSRTGYVFEGWTVSKSTESGYEYLFSANWAEDSIGPDGGSDGVPDKYQKKVNFNLVNGKWNSNSATSKYTVVTLIKEGKWDATGSAALTTPTDKTANYGYKSTGNWDVTPPESVSGTAEVTYTFTFDKEHDRTLRYKAPIEDTLPDYPSPLPTEPYGTKIEINPNGGIWNKIPIAFTLTVNDDFDFSDPTKEGYIFMGWLKTYEVFDKDCEYQLKALWEEDKIGPEDKPDEIADIFQRTISFSVTNGTWSDKTSETIKYVVTLRDNENNITLKGSATVIVPTGMIADEGYEKGAWNNDPGASISVDRSFEDVTNYSYSFSEITMVDISFYEYDGTNPHGPATGIIQEVIIKDCAKKYGDTSSVEKGSALVLPAEPSLKFYTFEGWFDADGKEWKKGDAVPESGLVLYAKYKRVLVGLIARDGSTTVIERGSTDKLNNLEDTLDYTENSVWYVYGLKVKLSETDLLGKYVTVAGDCRIELVRSSKNFYGTGSTITVIDNITNEVVEKFYIIIFGDIDGSGTIVSKDTTMCSEEDLGITTWSLKKTSSYNPIKVKAADLNGDGRIKSKDTTIISEKELGTGDINQVTGRYMEVKI